MKKYAPSTRATLLPRLSLKLKTRQRRVFAGFTLIELLVVIVIIGILATISVAQFNNYQEKARIAKLEAEISNSLKEVEIEHLLYREQGNGDPIEIATKGVDMIMKISELARIKANTSLTNITGSSCSNCYCRTSYGFYNGPYTDKSSNCYTILNNTSDALYDVTNFSLHSLTLDPWNSPYSLDENECENGIGSGFDEIVSFGPDRDFGGGDDISVMLPHYSYPECN